MTFLNRNVTDIVAREIPPIGLRSQRTDIVARELPSISPQKTDIVSTSGYDLLDKLSRRRQYVRSHARHKVPLLGLETEPTFMESAEMEIAGYG